MKDLVEIRKKQKEILERMREKCISSKYTITLLLDISGSMSGKKIEDAKEALLDFLSRVNLNENRIGLVAFGEEVKMSETNNNHKHLQEEIKRFAAGGGTPMMQAVKLAYEDFLRGEINPVMIIATDGGPTDSPEEEILEYANFIKGKGVWITTIGIGKDVNESFLKQMASSPTDYHFAKASIDLKKIYEKVADVLALPERRTNYLKEE